MGAGMNDAARGCRCHVCKCKPDSAPADQPKVATSPNRSPNAWSVGDSGEARTWDQTAGEYRFKRVKVTEVDGEWVVYRYGDGRPGTRRHSELRRLTA